MPPWLSAKAGIKVPGRPLATTLRNSSSGTIVRNTGSFSGGPGPQVPLYVSGAKMVEMFPVVPLAKQQALSIGVTSYDGGVYYGLNADRDAMADVDVLAATVEESIEELMGTVSG